MGVLLLPLPLPSPIYTALVASVIAAGFVAVRDYFRGDPIEAILNAKVSFQFQNEVPRNSWHQRPRIEMLRAFAQLARGLWALISIAFFVLMLLGVRVPQLGSSMSQPTPTITQQEPSSGAGSDC